MDTPTSWQLKRRFPQRFPSTNPVGIMAAKILNPACSNMPMTQLEEAVSLKPTTGILWIGSNDVLFSILFGSAPKALSRSDYGDGCGLAILGSTSGLFAEISRRT